MTTTDLRIVDEYFLLAHDDESGKDAGGLAGPTALAGAVLLDLAVDDLLAVEGKTLVARDGTPSHPVLAAALELVRGSEKARSASTWVRRLPPELKPLAQRVGAHLVDLGVVREEHRKVWGLFPSTQWVQSDPAPEARLRARLTAVLVDDETPDLHTAALVSLLSATDSATSAIGSVVAKEHRRRARARAKEITDTGAALAVSDAVRSAVQATQAALIAAVVVPAVVASGS